MTDHADQPKCPTCGAELEFVKLPTHMESANGGMAATDQPAGRWECPEGHEQEAPDQSPTLA